MDDTRDLIVGGEQQSVEFKSSLIVPTKPVPGGNEAAAKEMSAKILNDAGVAVASFMNRGGGVLLLGVDDDHKVLGVEADAKALNVEPGDHDLLTRKVADKLRSQIHGDGESARPYMQVNVVDVDGVEIVRVDVRQRWRLTYVKSLAGGKPELYERDGKSSPGVPIDRLQEFLIRTGRVSPLLPGIP